MRLLYALITLLVATTAFAEFKLEDNGAAITITENNKPVLVYNYGMVSPPKGVDEKYRRACYLHPVYGLDGEVLTQDFPLDHYHHRGVFWAWPDSTIGDEKIDVWTLIGVRPHHEKWIQKEAKDGVVSLEMENVWLFDDRPEVPQVREHVAITVHPEDKDSRAIDFDLHFTNVTDKEFVLRGATTDNKGYGGFSFRPDATRKPMLITTASGLQKKDVLEEASPWADISLPTERKSDTYSGVAIFQHPENPGFPHPGWILRHYGFNGHSWPHTTPQTFAPGEFFRLRYRIWIHRGKGAVETINAAFDLWKKESTN